MSLDIASFKKWKSSKQKPAPPEPAVRVIQSKPQATITNVVQASPGKIAGVTRSQPKATVTPPGFVGPVPPKQTSLVKPKPSYDFVDMFGPVVPKTQSAVSTMDTLGRDAIEQSNANVAKGFFTELPGAVKNTAVTVARSIPRTGLSFMSSAFGNEDPIIPESKAQKFLIGDEPVVPAARQTADWELALKEKGLNKSALPVALAGVVGQGFLDLYPPTSGKNKILKEGTEFLAEQLAKGVVKDEALNLLYKRYGTQVAKQLEKEALPKILEQGIKSGADDIFTKPLYRGGKEFTYDPKLDTGSTPFTTDRSVAEDFAKKGKGVVNERYLKPDAKVLDSTKVDSKDFDQWAKRWGYKEGKTMDRVIEYADDNGYDAVDFTKQGQKGAGWMQEVHVINPDKVLLKKSELPNLAPKVTSVTNQGKELKFINTVKDSPRTAPKLAEGLERIKTPGVTNDVTLKEAQDLVASDINEAMRVAKQTRPTAKSFATAQVLISKYSKEGNYEAAIDLVEITAKKAKQSGQAIQALSMWDRLTPEGVLKYAQRQFDNANELLPAKKKLKLGSDLADALRRHAENLQSLKPGSRERAVETAKMLKRISDAVPASIGKKISLVQTMGQLLNPKTLIRNIVGNTGFAVAENVKDVAATPLDWFVSKFTGQRTKSLPSLVTQAKGFKKGLVEGFEDAWLGIDTSAAATQFDLPKGQIFKNKILKGLEKTLSVALKAPDRAAYQAAFENSLSSQMKLSKATQATPEMLHIAHLDGLYRTFQDDSLASQAFVGIKKALNAGKDFGIGDLVLKYPKTPGNLLARGIDYSPAGFLKSTIELAKPLFGHEFNQRAFVEATSRAFTGTTALVGTGAILHRLGIITGKRDDDSDVNAMQRSTGLGQYKLNASGLMRFVLSGFDPDEAKLKEGDRTVSYDWFQPAAIGVSVGANIDDMLTGEKATLRNNPVGALLVSLGEGVDTLGEQPLVQGITRPFKYAESISDAALQALQGVPTSFIPTVLGQFRQVVDENQRNIEDPDYLKETWNLAKNKIPGLSETLPKKYGTLGEELKNENSIFETFISPAYMDKYEMDPVQKMVLDIYKNSGLKTQMPRLAGATETVNGKPVKLTGEQQSKMQQTIGKLTRERFNGLASNPKFLKLSDEDKAKTLAGIMTDIHTAAKYEQLGHRPKNLSSRTKKYIRLIRGTE